MAVPVISRRASGRSGLGPGAARLAAIAVLLALLAGCAGPGRQTASGPGPVPEACLISTQGAPGPEAAALARTVQGKNDIQRILGAMRAVAENLAYDPAGNPDQFSRVAEELFTDKTLGGCSEFALAQLAILRAMGYPARLALTMNAKWIARFRENALAVPNGHALVEVFVQGRWLLADPTGFVLYGRCPGPFLPGNEIVLTRAVDFWDAGMIDVESANAILRAGATGQKAEYAKPACVELGRVEFDYPKAFTNLGAVFLGKGKTELALRLFRKAVELAPDSIPARLGLAECLLGLSRPEQAGQHFRKVLDLAPADPAALAGLAKAEALAAGNEPAS